MIICAIMIAVGVYINRKSPSGPLRQRKIETVSPTTTGGKAIPVLINDIQNFLVGKRPNANKVPKGRPINKT